MIPARRPASSAPCVAGAWPGRCIGCHEDDLEKLIAISHVRRAAEEGVTRARLEEMREGIDKDIRKFRALLETPSARRKVAAA